MIAHGEKDEPIDTVNLLKKMTLDVIGLAGELQVNLAVFSTLTTGRIRMSFGRTQRGGSAY